MGIGAVESQIDNYYKDEDKIREYQKLEELEELVLRFDELTEEFISAIDKYEIGLAECDMLIRANKVKDLMTSFNDDLPII